MGANDSPTLKMQLMAIQWQVQGLLLQVESALREVDRLLSVPTPPEKEGEEARLPDGTCRHPARSRITVPTMGGSRSVCCICNTPVNSADSAEGGA